MTAPQRAQFSNRANVVDELFTEAKIDALNTKLIERGISADQVIAILPVAAELVVLLFLLRRRWVAAGRSLQPLAAAAA